MGDPGTRQRRDALRKVIAILAIGAGVVVAQLLKGGAIPDDTVDRAAFLWMLAVVAVYLIMQRR
jgi:hypothetical protein